MTGKIIKDCKTKNIARYFYQTPLGCEYLFYVLSQKSTLVITFGSDVLDYSFLQIGTVNVIYVVLECGVVGVKIPAEVYYVFKGGRLEIKLYSVELFEELAEVIFFSREKMKCGVSSENEFNDLGLFISSENNDENSFLGKIRKTQFFPFVSFLINNEKEKIWGVNIPVINDKKISDYLTLENKTFKSNLRNVVAFYLNSPQKSQVMFFNEVFKDNKNIFLVFLFATYVFYEEFFSHKVFSFYGDFLFSILVMRKKLGLYIKKLLENKELLTQKNFYSDLEEVGFFFGEKSFLFFNQKKLYKRWNVNDKVFLLNEKCFLMNKEKYFGSINKEWGIALLPGACVPVEMDKRYQLFIFPDKNNKIEFEYKRARVLVQASLKKIEIFYDFPLVEKIFVIASPFEILKIQKNGEYAPLIVKKNQDCVEVNCEEVGKIEIYLN